MEVSTDEEAKKNPTYCVLHPDLACYDPSCGNGNCALSVLRGDSLKREPKRKAKE